MVNLQNWDPAWRFQLKECCLSITQSIFSREQLRGKRLIRGRCSPDLWISPRFRRGRNQLLSLLSSESRSWLIALHVSTIKDCVRGGMSHMFQEKRENCRKWRVGVCGQAPQENETHRRRMRVWSRGRIKSYYRRNSTCFLNTFIHSLSLRLSQAHIHTSVFPSFLMGSFKIKLPPYYLTCHIYPLGIYWFPFSPYLNAETVYRVITAW